MVVAAAQPWGAQIGPFALAQYSALPKRSWEFLPKFHGDRMQDSADHIKAVIVACGILGVQEEDVFVRLFVQSLMGKATEWFQHLQDGCITTWDDLEQRFLKIFQPTINSHQLLVNLLQVQMKEDEFVREFIDRFN